MNKEENLHLINVYYYHKDLDNFSLTESNSITFPNNLNSNKEKSFSEEGSFFKGIEKVNGLKSSFIDPFTILSTYTQKIEINEDLILPECSEYFIKIQANLICSLCKGIIIDPVSCKACSQAFCRACITKLINDNLKCINECFPIQINNEIEKSISIKLQKIKIKCYLCDVICTLYDYGKHLIICEEENKEILCWLCCKGKLLIKNQKYTKEEIEKLQNDFILLEDECKLEKEKCKSLEEKYLTLQSSPSECQICLKVQNILKDYNLNQLVKNEQMTNITIKLEKTEKDLSEIQEEKRLLDEKITEQNIYISKLEKERNNIEEPFDEKRAKNINNIIPTQLKLTEIVLFNDETIMVNWDKIQSKQGVFSINTEEPKLLSVYGNKCFTHFVSDISFRLLDFQIEFEIIFKNLISFSI